MNNIIIGLGNTGEKYIFTRHNIGQYIVFKLKKEFNGSLWVEETLYKHNTINIENHKVCLVISKEYMNTSGIFLKKILLSPDTKNLIVIHDDISIESGKCKLSFARSDAGHNGVRSIFDVLKNRNFFRVRVGIGANKKNLKKYVLEKLNDKEQKNIDILYDNKIVPTIKYLLKDDLQKAYQMCNTKD